MPTKILLKKGLNANVASLSLASGEPAFTTDTGKLYVGNGASNVLINPIAKPSGLNVTNFYSKLKVNDFGQVVSQAPLTADDIPNIPSSKVSGLGDCASINTGLTSGKIPLLDITNKFPAAVIPVASSSTSFMLAWNSLNTTLNVLNGANFVYDAKDSYLQDISLSSDGYVQLNTPGAYFISYHITSKTNTISTALYCPAVGILGGQAANSTAATPSFVSTSGSYIFSIGVAPQKVSVQNIGLTTLTIPSPYTPYICVVKIM